MISRIFRYRIIDILIGLASFLEVHLITLSGTTNALHYVKRFGLLSLALVNGNLKQPLILIFNRIISLFNTDQVCLKRSLFLYALYKKTKNDVAVAFGMKRIGDGKLIGHCWVEIDGQPLEINDFTLIKRFF
ncbi:MAG: lasso peptide biosynthesis B2 protein [candidate division WOR-3 bacterium]